VSKWERERGRERTCGWRIKEVAMVVWLVVLAVIL